MSFDVIALESVAADAVSRAVGVHHFLLRQTGGAIEVSASDPADTESINQVRSHFRDIAASFLGEHPKPAINRHFKTGN